MAGRLHDLTLAVTLQDLEQHQASKCELFDMRYAEFVDNVCAYAERNMFARFEQERRYAALREEIRATRQRRMQEFENSLMRRLLDGWKPSAEELSRTIDFFYATLPAIPPEVVPAWHTWCERPVTKTGLEDGGLGHWTLARGSQ